MKMAFFMTIRARGSSIRTSIFLPRQCFLPIETTHTNVVVCFLRAVNRGGREKMPTNALEQQALREKLSRSFCYHALDLNLLFPFLSSNQNQSNQPNSPLHRTWSLSAEVPAATSRRSRPGSSG